MMNRHRVHRVLFFFSLQAAGTLDELAADATFNLGQLADQAGRFIDFGELRLAGDGWGHFQWKRQPTGQFATSVDLQIREFQLALPERQPWHEDRLLLFLSADGQTDFADETLVQQGQLQHQLLVQHVVLQALDQLRSGLFGTTQIEQHLSQGPLRSAEPGLGQKLFAKVDPAARINRQGLGFTYTASRPTNKVHPDSRKTPLLTDGRGRSAADWCGEPGTRCWEPRWIRRHGTIEWPLRWARLTC